MGQVSFKPPQTRAVSTAFDPTSLSGKILWLRAKDETATTGSSVATWEDVSGLSNHAVATGTAPTVVTGGTPNSGRVIRFNATPVKTSRGLQYREQAVASDTLGTFYPAYHVFNGTRTDSSSEGWASSGIPSGGVPIWVRVKPASATTATSMEMYGDLDARLPKDFKVQGSMDASSWTDLATVTGATVTSSKVTSGTFTNITAYTYYRLLITANQTAAICQIDELTLNNTANPSITTASYGGEIWAVIKGSTAQSRDWWGNGDTWFKFGGDPGGVWYDDFALSGTRVSFTPTQRTDQWRQVRITCDGSLVKYYIDNTLEHTNSSAVPLWDNFVQLGNGAHDIAEVFMRDVVSDSTAVANLTAYFNTEHGLTVT